MNPRMIIAAMFAILISVNGLLGADLKVEGELTVKPYRMVRLVAGNADADAAILWDIYPEESVDLKEFDRELYFVAPPGTYRVKLRTVKGREVKTARAVVVIGDKPKPPDDGKPPKPDDPAPPKPDGKFYLALIRPDGPASREFTKTMELVAWDVLRERGHLIKDMGTTVAKELGLILPASAPLPYVVYLRPDAKSNTWKQVQNPDGTPLVGRFPTTDAEVADILKAVNQ